MNNLTTRKIVLGLLLTLVLAFSVQGTADAISRLTRSSGDLQTVTAGDDYQIRFSVTLQSPSRIPGFKPVPSTDESDPPVSVPAAERANMFYDDDPDIEYIHGETTIVDYADAHYYDQESISITTSGGTIEKVGSVDVPAARQTKLPMYERTHAMYSTTENADQRLSGSVSLTLTAPTKPAIVTITIGPTTDGSGTFTEQPDLIFTIYVVGPLNAAGTAAVATGDDGVERVSDQSDTQINTDFLFTPAANEPVYYTVEGSGRLYVSPASDRKTSPTNNLYTSSSAPVYLDTNGGSSKVTAYIAGSGDTATVLYLFSGGRLSELPQIEVQSGSPQTGAPEGQLDNYFEVRVTDGRRRAISGLPVTFTKTDPAGATAMSMFIPVSGTKVYAAAPASTSIDAVAPITVEATSTNPSPEKTHSVQTDRNGVAKIYYQLSDTPGVHTVTATAYGIGINATLTATASTTARAGVATLEIVSGNNQRAEKGKFLDDDLVVIVRSLAGHRIQNRIIQFRTTAGILVPASGTNQPTLTELGFTDTPANQARNPARGQQIYVKTGPNGEAGVTYNVGQLTEAREIVAEVRHEAGDTQYDFAIDRVTFNVNGGGSQPTQPTQPQPTAFTISPLSITGAPGSTQPITVTTPAGSLAQVGNPVFGEFLNAGGSASPTTGSGTFTSDLTLPSTEGTFDLIVSIGADRRTVSVTVDSTPAPGTQTGGTLSLRIEPGSGAPGTSSVITVTATDEDGNPASGIPVSLSITPGGGVLAPSSGTTGTNGTFQSILTRGSTPGTNYFINATTTASGYTFSSILPQGERVVISGTPPTTTPGTPTTRAPAGDPDTIDIYDGDRQSGGLNVQLRDPFIVEVLDANGTPVENVRVGFQVTQGTGRLSPRSALTDRDGFAEIYFTPTSPGEIIVRARVSGVDAVDFTVIAGDPPESLAIVSGDNQAGTPGSRLANPLVVEVRDEDGDPIEGIRVSFSVTAGGGTVSPTSATTNAQGRTQTSLTLGSERAINSVQARVNGVGPVTFDTSIDPVVHVSAANRPVMYWIDGGALYRLAGAKAEQIAASASDVAVDAAGGKIYWIEGTSSSTGRIHSANLNGTGATVVKELTSVPMGLAHDSANGKLYLTNSWGKIQRMNVDGTGFETNLIVGLGKPIGIAVSSGRVYWTDAAGSVRYANTEGTKVVRNIATGSGALGGIAAGSDKVYWTEQTSATTGRIRSANLDGSGAADLFTLTAVPHGIAVDGNTVYWANGWGKVQRRNVDRSKFQDIVTGLMSPGALAIGGANVATPAQPQTPQQPTTVKSKYDVNNDGTVDTTDVGIVVAAVLSGSQQASLDVNGDGKVDLSDVVAVSQNVDNSGAAAAPALRTRLSAVQVDRIQEQIDLLLGMNDRSPGALYTLQYLQNLLAMARPEKTQLLANYPNPFNPETWIPYELATDTNVKLTIYDAQGTVVRTLSIGHQSAGYYTSRDRAAYWDGRNSFGELVASGLYFYQLETDEASLMRKMVILK